MTKQELIDDMAKIVDEMYNVYITIANIAEGLYNAGYRKIDDDCAVITKSELKQYKAQAVKEFAEKLKNKLLVFFQDNEELDGKISVGPLYVDIIGVEAEDGTIISLGLIDKLLKEFEEWKTISIN